MDHVENLHVDGQHEEQGGQHPAEEVEVDHVVHADDRLELAGDQQVFGQQGAVVAELLQVVPAHHGGEAHHDGHQPAEEHGQAGPPRRHHPLVAGAAGERERERAEASVRRSLFCCEFSLFRLQTLRSSHRSSSPPQQLQ